MSQGKNAWAWVLMVIALLLVGAAAAYILWPKLQVHTTVHIGDAVFTTRVAKTADQREKGLAGTGELRQDQAMLLVYESDGKWPIWMKDMKYPIDIVWLDSEKKIVYIVKNAPPESYPYDQFVPKHEARYVLELPAGTVTQKSIKAGAEAVFDENNMEGWGL